MSRSLNNYVFEKDFIPLKTVEKLLKKSISYQKTIDERMQTLHDDATNFHFHRAFKITHEKIEQADYYLLYSHDQHGFYIIEIFSMNNIKTDFCLGEMYDCLITLLPLFFPFKKIKVVEFITDNPAIERIYKRSKYHKDLKKYSLYKHLL